MEEIIKYLTYICVYVVVVVSISVPSVVLGVQLLGVIYRVCEKVSKKWQKRKRADGCVITISKNEIKIVKDTTIIVFYNTPSKVANALETILKACAYDDYNINAYEIERKADDD